jgi:hypothetical protein
VQAGETRSSSSCFSEWFNYGWTALHRLPAALTEPNSVTTGTVMRPVTVRGFAEQGELRHGHRPFGRTRFLALLPARRKA